MRTTCRAVVLTVLATAGGAACATSRAAEPLERPALDMPAPPPRVIVPLPRPETPLPDPVGQLPGTDTPPPAKPRPPRPEKETQKPEAKPTEETKPPETPPSTVTPVPQLRIPEKDPAIEPQIRSMIDRTLATLGGIDYGKLQQPRQKAYDDAKMFATQADEQLKLNNLVLAKEYAEKAERLVKELTGR